MAEATAIPCATAPTRQRTNVQGPDILIKPPQTQASCRPGCGACCIAPSISTPMPKMPNGKRAGERCAHLTLTLACELFGRPQRPPVCRGLQPSSEMCGSSREHALAWLENMEHLTRPDA